MKQWMLGWGVLLCGSALAQQVWKCEEAGQVRYSDQPCQALGRPLPASSLQPNGVDTATLEAVLAASAPQAGAAPADRSKARRTVQARSPQRDAWAPPPGFVQRGNPRTQQKPPTLPTP